MRSKKYDKISRFFSVTPLSYPQKKNKIKILIRAVRWQRVNASMAPRQLCRGTEQARWQRSNVE
jgi:hypothetical protein